LARCGPTRTRSSCGENGFVRQSSAPSENTASLFGTVITLIACGLEERGYRNYRRGRDLLRRFVLALFENI
jgi:hypothetical protein